MKIIKPYAKIIDVFNGYDILRKIEKIGRVCYKSENKITNDSAKDFVSMIIKRGHEAILEHASVTVKFVCDRGISHELVRHRVASYAQESTRYCNYSNNKFGNELTFIKPFYLDDWGLEYARWLGALKKDETVYFKLVDEGLSPQEARGILPNCLKTEIYMTANLREWRHFFNLRCDVKAHPQMRELTLPLLQNMHKIIPVVFDDIYDKFKNDMERIALWR